MTIQILTSSIARPSKIYPNRDFWFKIWHLATLDEWGSFSDTEVENRVARFFLGQPTKTRENILNGNNYTKRPQNIPYGRNIFEMATEYTNFFHSEALQNVPKFGFFWFETIWQPWFRALLRDD
jgi:hypothetical protein